MIIGYSYLQTLLKVTFLTAVKHLKISGLSFRENLIFIVTQRLINQEKLKDKN